MKAIVTIEISDNSTPEVLAKYGQTYESVRMLTEQSFIELMEATSVPGSRYTVAVQIEDNTKVED